MPALAGAVGQPIDLARPMAEAVRRVLREMDREMIATPQTVRANMDEQAARLWVPVRLILVLGIVAMMIAVIGIYGVVAFAVSRRSKEMGIRAALGATRNDIIGLVLRSGLKPVLVGLAAGLLFAVAGSVVLVRVLSDLPIVFEIGDPLVYLSVSLLLSLAALAAMCGPAWRAAKAEPMRALRQD